MEVLSISAFVTGGVQILKKFGVKDDVALMVWGFILGGVYGLGIAFYPGVLESFLGIIVGVQTTGNVGLAFELIDRFKGKKK